MFSQTGDSCSTAKSFIPSQPIEPDETQVIQTQWFAFTATDVQLRLTLINRINLTSDKANQIFIWSGSCGSLTLMGSDTLSDASDSVLSITLGSITNGATYYFQVNKSNGTDTINYFVDRKYKLLDPTCITCGLPVNPCELICNGSFETNGGPPTNPVGGEINLSCAWDRPTANTPDYYTSVPVGATPLYSVPGPNFAGVYPAFTGNSYAGFYARSTGAANWHEYIYQQLRCPLVAGVTYNCSFWVIRATSAPGIVANIGAWFTDAAGLAPWAATTTTINAVPQVMAGGPIASAVVWTNINQNFVATGTETFIVIGNFDFPARPGARAYYLLDEVTLTPVTSAVTVSATPNPICLGATSTLSNSLGLPLDWTPSADLSCSTCPSPIFTPTTSGSTTFTGVLTFCAGCSISGSTTVTVDPGPVITSEPNLNYCAGDPVPANTFVSTPAGATFTWTNSNTAIGLAASGTASLPAFTATNATSLPITSTITVTPTLGSCLGTPITFTITVNPLPPNIDQLPSVKYCAGDIAGPFAFTPVTAGVTFTWTNSNIAIGLVAAGTGNIPAFIATNATAGPISGIITVTPILGGCSGTPMTFTIVVNPSPIITATAVPPIISLGGSSTLTAFGGTTYTWSNGSMTNPTIVSPATTTTYTVTGWNQFGCSSTASVTVTVIYPNCGITTINVPDGTVASTFAPMAGVSASGQNYKIQGTLIMDKSFLFVGCNLLMEASGTTVPNIQVTNNSTLQLTQQTHVFSCTDMWDGIYVTSGSRIITKGSAIIEDGKKAVNIPQGAQGAFEETVFNKNLFAIMLTANTSASTPIQVKNCVFTCRYIPTFPIPGSNPLVSIIKANLSLATPTPPAAVLRSPYPYGPQKGFVGIYAQDVKNLTVGNTSSTIDKNVFDAIMTGIKTTHPTTFNSTATIYNNHFQYLLGYSGPAIVPPPGVIYPFSNGYGIDAVGKNATSLCTIDIGGNTANQPNTFKNTYGAILVRNYKTNNIFANAITNTSTGPFFPSAPLGTVNYGNGGIYVLPSQATGGSVFIANQALIKNCANAIWVNHGAGGINTTLLQIDNNGSAGSPCILADASGYCTNGIYITDLVSSTVAPTFWSISNNFIREATNCIVISNVRKSAFSTVGYNIFGNSCRTRYAAIGMRTGIKITGSRGLNITNNHTNYTPTGTAYIAGDNITAYGLFVQNSTNLIVKCNLFENAGRSMTFDGPCSSSTTAGFGITQNTMRRAQDGLVLLSISTVIGQQGSGGILGVASNNVWDMSTSPNFTFQTRSASTTTNTTSKLYVKGIATGATATVPTLNGIIGTGVAFSPSTSPLFPLACSGTPPPALATGSAGMPPADLISYTNDLKIIEEDSTLLPVYNLESRWQLRKFVFDEVDDNTPYAVHPALSAFYAAHTGGSFNKFLLVDRKIAQGFFIQANIINNSVVPVNIVESNQQTVNTQILQKLITPSYVYSLSDITSIDVIANQCPLEGGNAVYQARILLMAIAANVIEFDDNCDYNVERSMQTMQTNSIEEPEILFKLYPNPNNGTMLLDYKLNATDKAEIKIYDVAGKLISKYELNSSSTQINIHDDLLNSSIYFYQIKVNDRVVQSDKLIIIR